MTVDLTHLVDGLTERERYWLLNQWVWNDFTWSQVPSELQGEVRAFILSFKGVDDQQDMTA